MRKTVLVLTLALCAGLTPVAFGAPDELPLTPLECEDSIFVSMRLANSLWDCDIDGLNIAADNITLDLNGKTIDGDDQNDNASDFDEEGIGSSGFNGVTIKNGLIRDFEEGLDLNGDGIKVSNVQTITNIHNGLTIAGDANKVVKSVASDNTTGFIFMGSDNVARSNQAFDNVTGISFGGSDGLAEKNFVAGNRTSGFFVAGSGHLLRSNRANGNGRVDPVGSGFEVTVSASAITFLDNVAIGNSLYGFHTTGDTIKFDGNRANENGRHGIAVDAGDGIKLFSSKANTNGFFQGDDNNTGLGISIDPGVTNVKAKDNIAKNNDDAAQCSAAANCN
jgi:hypothetical protein